MGYHLVDEVKGMARSRRLIKSFEYFEDAKSWLISHVDELYGFIPEYDPKKSPDFSGGQSLQDLNSKLNKKGYNGWRLQVISSRNLKGYRGKSIIKTEYRKVWFDIKTMSELGRPNAITGNGVSWMAINNLEKEEQNIVAHARLTRVLTTTPKAVLIEWTGKKGTATTWIYKGHLV